jgi:hypothetical protein
MNSKALTLSINFIAILIISLAVFALGIYTVRYFIGTAEQVSEEISLSAERQINELLASTNEKVVLPVFRRELKSGQSYTFVLGIKNYLEQPADFTVEIGFSGATTGAEQEYIPSTDISKWYFEQLGPFRLADSEKKIVALPFRAINAQKGVTYVFDVKVACNLNTGLCNPYGYNQRIYLEII